MIILSNCLTDRADEGCLKLANSLVKRLLREKPDTMVISYGASTLPGDMYLPENKFMFNRKLFCTLWNKKEELLYIPAVAKAHTMAVRVFILSLFARKGINVVQVMQYQTGAFSRMLLKLSGAHLITFSRDSWRYYDSILKNKVYYLQTGVDTQKFCPVSENKKIALREKYGLPTDKKLVLHVGHMRVGRNVEKLKLLDDRFRGVLVASTYSLAAQDQHLRRRLKAEENITLIDKYIPNIEEVYQLADIYLFPVEAEHNCIDVPLSALEAAACNIPVVATSYGELKELLGKDGFYKIESFEPGALNDLIYKAIEEKRQPRSAVLPYDWDLAVDKLLKNLSNK